MTVPNYKPFNVVSARTDIQQLYASTDDHAWIKEQASDNNVRMTSVIAALVDHAKNSDKVFKHMLSLLKQQDYILAQGGKLPEKVTAEIQELLEQYGV